MIELFIGVLIGASLAILALHLSGRLTPIKAAETTYTGSNRIAALGVDLAGNNGPKLDPYIVKRLEDVLPELKRFA